LDHAGDDTDGEREVIGIQVCCEIFPSRIAEAFHSSEDDDDQSGSRAFDCEGRVADERGNNSADDRGENSGYGREPAGDGDSEAEGESDEKDEKSGNHILFERGCNSRSACLRSIAGVGL